MLSRLMLIRSSPASFNSSSFSARRLPLVVMERSLTESTDFKERIISTILRRSRGSPPVRRTSVIPSVPAGLDKPQDFMASQIMRRRRHQQRAGRVVSTLEITQFGKGNPQRADPSAERIVQNFGFHFNLLGNSPRSFKPRRSAGHSVSGMTPSRNSWHANTHFRVTAIEDLYLSFYTVFDFPPKKGDAR